MSSAVPTKRLASLDALRGFDMFWITGGGGLIIGLKDLFGGRVLEATSAQMHHVPWHGFHFEDLIFPLFVFIVGLSIPFSLTQSIDGESAKAGTLKRILRRAFLLLLLGLIYTNGLSIGQPLSEIRFCGVLQRMSLCYLFSSLAVLRWGPKGLGVLAGLILAAYWAMMMLVPVPGFGAGNLTPEGNLAGYVDRLLVPGRLYRETWDPEGLLSTFPAIASCLLGVLAGQWIRSSVPMDKKLLKLVGSGAVGVLLGCALNGLFPINKALWSPTFVFLTAGIGAVLLALFIWLVDVKGFSRWTFFFVVIGSNSILIYMLQDLFSLGSGLNELKGVGDVLFGFLGGGRPLVVEMIDVACKWLPLYILYRKKIFIRV